MSMRKKRATTILMATVVERKIVGRTITKKIISRSPSPRIKKQKAQPSWRLKWRCRWSEQRLVKKFKDYNFTPPNAEISEVLMEIKKRSSVLPTTKYTR